MIFLDSSYIKGLILKRDSLEKSSKNLRPHLINESKAINITVLVEVLNSLKKNNYHGNINEIIQMLCGLEVFDWLTLDDYKSALEKFKYYNGAINYSDCTILVSMEKYGITRLVTYDSAFSKVKGLRIISGFF